jgi:nucleoside diphosphate kinase
MSATNPPQAAAGTIRQRFAASIERISIQGSNTHDTGPLELGWFFSTLDLA